VTTVQTLRTVGARAVPRLLDGTVLLPADGDDLVDAPPGHDLAAHLRAYGPGPAGTEGLLAAVEAAGLTGHGGAHVPAAAKWRRALAAGEVRRVVANGCEGEPVSAKDSVLLRLRPHLVLDGLALTARVLGAREVVVRVHAGSPVLAALAAALRERGAAGIGGPPVRVEEGPGGYVAGESSAVLRALDGGPALPAWRHPDAVPRDVVHNVETLARVALTARGADPGGGLVTVLAGGWRTVLDTPPDATVGDALAAGGAPADRPVLAGGYAGTWLPAGSAPALWEPGAPTGAGVLAVLPAGACGLAETARLLGYLAAASAGQCGPCVWGLPSIAALADRLAAGRLSARGLDRLRAEADQVRGRGACHHPDGAVRLLAGALQVFADDVTAHVRHSRCVIDRDPDPALPTHSGPIKADRDRTGMHDRRQRGWRA
jgi:NADH:ubiquinone oxidoreductase subunit F (NADH-binding)